MKSYSVEVVVHMQVLVTVEAEDENRARSEASYEVRSRVNGLPIDIIDLTIADTYIAE